MSEMHTKDNRPGSLQEFYPAGITLKAGSPSGLLEGRKTPERLIYEIIYVTIIAIGFAITAGAFCEFLLKPLWHSLGKV